MISARKFVCYLQRKTRKNILGISGKIRVVCFRKFVPNLSVDTIRIAQQIRCVSRERYAKTYSKYFLANTQRISQEILIGRSSPAQWAISGHWTGALRALVGSSAGARWELCGQAEGTTVGEHRKCSKRGRGRGRR